jgi:hypothetical protein
VTVDNGINPGEIHASQSTQNMIPIGGMAKSSFIMPRVFVGCPYGKPFDYPAFKKALSKIPIAWYYADTSIRSKHLLANLSKDIRVVDFCVFDVSLWNPNVTLELGLAQGSGKGYYILANQKQSKDVPSDIKGIQRIEYNSIKSLSSNGLIPSIVNHLIKHRTHPRNIWEKLSNPNKERKFYFALFILAHFRDNKRLSHYDKQELSRGLYLRHEAQNEVIKLLKDMKLLSCVSTRQGAKLAKRIFPGQIINALW